MSVLPSRDFAVVGRPVDAEFPDAERSGLQALPSRDTWQSKEREKPIGGAPKRLFDILVAAGALIVAAPMLLLIAAAVKLNMGGPVVYRHRRVGYNGEPFDCLKFRTMVTNADEILQRYLDENPSAAMKWGRHRKLANDPRVTRFGLLLRKTSLDELPQLVNILRGEMSWVGPRPVVADEITLYGEHALDYFRARPGITGPWQVSGRSAIGYSQRVIMDSEYVRGWSLTKDLLIILRTPMAALRFGQAA